MSILKPQQKSRLSHVRTDVLDVTNNPEYRINLFLPARAWEYAGEDVSPCRGHQSLIMHPAILPEFGVIAGSLPVDDSCNLDENVVRKEVAVSEVDPCIRGEVSEQLLNELRSTDVKESR
jgi:hypothetical protein